MNSDVARILPELLMAAGGMILLLFPFLRGSGFLAAASLLLLAAAAWLKAPLWREEPAVFFSGMLAQERFGLFVQFGILAATALGVVSAAGYARESVRGRREFYALLLFSAAGLSLLAAAQHLALVYLGLELVSILSYLLVGFQKRDSLSIEGALKYFLFGALSTGAMLYGISLIYGLTGTMDLTQLAHVFPDAAAQAPLLAAIALLLLLAGLAFKLALVPFHMWAPDAYEGAAAPVASFISLGPKLAGFAVLVRVVLTVVPSAPAWPFLLAVLAAVTMTVGNVAALAQTNLKRLLAYSSIAHAGTMLIGAAVATPLGITALLYYLVAYLLMNAGAFLGVILVGNAVGREDLSAFSGLSRRAPATAFLMTICLVSLAGIPPLGGFFAKMWIFAAALQAGAVWLAVVAAVNSVIALFYYARILKAMYLDLGSSGGPIPSSRPLLAALAFCALALLWLGLGQGPWLDTAAASLPLR